MGLEAGRGLVSTEWHVLLLLVLPLVELLQFTLLLLLLELELLLEGVRQDLLIPPLLLLLLLLLVVLLAPLPLLCCLSL